MTPAELRAVADEQRAESNRLRTSSLTNAVKADLLERREVAAAEVLPLVDKLSDRHAQVLAAELELAALDSELVEARRMVASLTEETGSKDMRVRAESHSLLPGWQVVVRDLEAVRAERVAVVTSTTFEREQARHEHDAAAARVAVLDEALNDPLGHIEGKATTSYLQATCLGGEWVAGLLASAAGREVPDFDRVVSSAMLDLVLVWSGRGAEITESAALEAAERVVREMSPIELGDGRRVVAGVA